MFACPMLHHQLQTLHVSVEIVARMLHIRTHTEVFRRLRLCQPVLSLNVITLLLLRCESRCEEGEVGARTQMACDSQRTEEGTEEVFLLSIEVDTELSFTFSQRTEVCLTVFWLEVITVVRDVTDEVYLPTFVGLP